MTRLHFLTIFLFFSFAVVAQEKITPTDKLQIDGAVGQSRLLTLDSFLSSPAVAIPDVIITNHLGEPRSTYKGLKGILLKTVLEKSVFSTPGPKQLSEFYLVLEASDGYKVVYSWNELFNTVVGEQVYIVTEKDGKKLAEIPDRILAICAADRRTGRRTVKGLQYIHIRRVE
ncbi:hypothetical protein [Flavihumibacter petaseus]|uniref:Oxidoreductase molybdopterin-binding domain-containing protein n=1 Tax=Flavihumibacter petaseus NBRC 106054 TaxID=1220578 RepID=A0A0E9N504_9BACT|nr:hypothetical protein [Flavihumibacter petaseus]GAO44873.1 hypothetical protein FPE01S_04_01160 [Flavihumibacter petaseus NBRC 106054]